MSAEETKNWLYALISLSAVSGFFLTIQLVFGPVITFQFQLFAVYLPTAFSLIIYLILRLRRRAGP